MKAVGEMLVSSDGDTDSVHFVAGKTVAVSFVVVSFVVEKNEPAGLVEWTVVAVVG